MAFPSTAVGLVTQLSHALGIEGLAFDEDGIITLRTGDDLHVSLACDPAEDALILCGQVHGNAASLDTAMLRRLLATNIKLAGSGSPAFAIVPQAGTVVLEQRLSLNALTYGDFEAAWMQFVDQVEKSKDKITEAAPDVPATAEDAPFALQDHISFLRP